MNSKPKRPVGCPLFYHATGQWARKVGGKFHYFGKDLDEALKRWATSKDRILAGLPEKPVVDDRPTISELGNLYVNQLRQRALDDDITERSISESIKSIGRMIEILGSDTAIEGLRPLDFASLKTRLHEPVKRTRAIRGGIKGIVVDRRSPVTAAGDIRRLRAFLNWCSDNEFCLAPRWGKEFHPIKAKQARRARNEAGRRLLSPAEIKSILNHASVGMKPIILMGINAAMGSTDIANLKLIDFAKMEGEVWIDSPRGKTEAARRFVLWPETRNAIKAWVKDRPTPCNGCEDRLFLTRDGSAWVRNGTDAIAKSFGIARDKAGLTKGTFYDLRRAFQTVGDQTGKYRAVKLVMGHIHSESDMSARYTVEISDDQIKAVCDHVRKWLFGKKGGAK